MDHFPQIAPAAAMVVAVVKMPLAVVDGGAAPRAWRPFDRVHRHFSLSLSVSLPAYSVSLSLTLSIFSLLWNSVGARL